MFGFTQEQDFSQEQGFITCSHLRDAAIELGLDAGCAYGLSADMEAEQLAGIQQALQAAIDAELERLARLDREDPPCHIGPYANKRCKICGLREP